MRIDLPSDWLEEFTYDESVYILADFARFHAEKAGPFAEELVSLIRDRDYASLCSYEPDYRRPGDVDHFRNLRQALGFFQKLEPLDIGIDKRRNAFEKFVEAEHDCQNTNDRLRKYARGEFLPCRGVAGVLHAAQRNIARALGSVPHFDMLEFCFGPGASTTVKSSASSPRFKLGSKLACSANMVGAVRSVLNHAPEWCKVHAKEDNEDSFLVDVEIHAGRLMFVPKNAKTYRSIVVEPVLNSFAQKGIGTYLKRRLRSVGVDLSDQTRNQKLAKLGSLNGSLATVDLSSASDTISKEIVANLLPIDWYSFLSNFRTGEVAINEEVIHLEKFSSMGNAFTFELESLIFWGLTLGVCQHLGVSSANMSIYGDDIIVPVEAYDLLVEVLGFCGFSVNYGKSFNSGPFRESCGADWFFGSDVRPYYQKKLVTGETLFSLHNFYVRRFEFDAARVVLKYIHPDLQIWGPDGYGDGHLIGTFSPRFPKKLSDRGWDGCVFDTFAHRGRRICRGKILPGDAVLPSYSVYVRSGSESRTDIYSVRGSVGYERRSIYTLNRGIFFD